MQDEHATAQEIIRRELFNIEAEQTILGTIIINNDYINRVADFLLPEHFYEPANKKIYEQIIHTVNKVNIIANQVTLKQFFENDQAVKSIGGSTYLSTLLARATGVIDIADYAKLVYDLALKRELVMIGEGIVADAYKADDQISATAQVEEAENKLFNLTKHGGSGSDFRNISVPLKQTLEKALVARGRDSHISGISTGLDDLDHMLSGMQNSDLIILAARPSMGKAQPLDAKVLTKNGWKKMGDLKIGEELVAVDGAKSKVKGIFPQGKKQIYRITFSDGRSTECCAEHLWKVYYRDWEEAKILDTSSIINLLTKVRYQGRLWIEQFSGEFGSRKTMPIDPWVLGALLGDGNLCGGQIRFSSADSEMIKILSKKIGKGFTVKYIDKYNYRIINSDGRTKVGVQGVVPNALKESLKKLNLWDVHSDKKFIPDSYFNSDYQTRLDLLRGLLDTDGWVEKWGSIRFATSSKELAGDVANLVRSLGGLATISTKQPTYTHKQEKKNGLPSFVINIQHPDQKTFFLLSRKKSRLSDRQRQKRLTITSIKPTRKAEAQCIAVSHPSHLYITDDYVVTHNTALAINIAVNACKFLNKDIKEAREKKAVGFFSLEMSSDQLSARILSMETSINATKFRSGEITEDDWEVITKRSAEIADMPFFIDDTPGLTIPAIRTRVRRMVRKHNLGLLFIDYLQLIYGTSKKSSESRVQEISEITRGLKAIAKEFNIPVMALSQLSRAVEQREDKRPQLSDLRESGSIEQDADVVGFIFRESYYEERKRPSESDVEKFKMWKAKMDELRNRSELIIAKQRNGPIGTVNLYFDPEFTRFNNLDLYH